MKHIVRVAVEINTTFKLVWLQPILVFRRFGSDVGKSMEGYNID